jgi:hypothetical protein
LLFQFAQVFRASGLILFLNKTDLFEEKVSRPDNRVSEFFPDFSDRADHPGSIL